jgi:hypothetical protein
MMYCRQFGEQNRPSRMGAQPEPGGVVAQQQGKLHFFSEIFLENENFLR